ncbi:MAG: hypothetical protein K8U57_01960 [Planctomycetes bacterium]|nr:hypothetical protein [Planctomycetota bacterium]
MWCWFEIDPQTGEQRRQVERPAPGPGRTLYLQNGAFDAFFDIAWAFRSFLAPHPRPPFEDLVAFVVDGTIPTSMMPLVGADLAQHRKAIQDFWAGWDQGEEGYPTLVGRPMLRDEKYWLVEDWLRCLAVGREQFYAGKTLYHEEWLVDWRAWDGKRKRWTKGRQGRLRIFTDGTADAWCPGLGLLGFDTEQAARDELGAAGYGEWEEIKTWFTKLGDDHDAVTDPPAPPVAQADDPRQPFRYQKE